ncbi:two-component regulator propeller domain-containing protein [Paraflavisolibacter sp. H34]|uniref:hybrid sensor histidine kinase/response regulator transcription factor n=1 Tax=Huijunlia imazamoxiresistens TaxID=3127457 RepID=UPI0030179108
MMAGREILRTILWWVLLFGWVSLQAQVKSKTEHYSTEDGLSHDGVMAITKCREGFMWFGTWDGLNRYDGHTFTTYKSRPGDSSHLKSNRIESIVEDKAGYLWLRAYDNQVYRFDKKTATFWPLASLLPKGQENNTFNRVFPQSNGQVWCTTAANGIYCIRAARPGVPVVLHYGKDEKERPLPSNHVNFLFEDQQHTLWIGTEKGLCRLPEGVVIANLLQGQNVTAIAEDKNKIWLGTASGLLAVFEKASRQLTTKQLSAFRLNALHVSKNGAAVYAATAGGEVITVDAASLTFRQQALPQAEPLHSIYEDRSGQLWIEPQRQGVIKYHPQQNTFQRFLQKTDAFMSYTIREYSVFEDRESRLWVAMKGGGFGWYDPSTNEVKPFTPPPGASPFSNAVTVKYYDPAGVLWLSTGSRGVEKIIFQSNEFATRPADPSAAAKTDNDIRGIFCDDHHRLWLAAKSGRLYLREADGRPLTHFFLNEPPGGLGLVYTLLQDRSGTMWLGTKGNGLFRADLVSSQPLKYRLTHYAADPNDPYSLSSNLVYSLLEDRQGRIWIGTFEKGLNLLVRPNGKETFLHARNAFANYPPGLAQKIRHLQLDGQGRVWAATTDGLLLADGQAGAEKQTRFVLYQKIPGDKESLGTNDLQFIHRDAKNRMWIATAGGGLNEAIAERGKPLRFRVFTREQGLPSDYLLSIAEDRAGNLWLATENGLSRFTPQTGRFRNYDSYDGLPRNGFSEASALGLPDGNLLFGTLNGYLLFQPSALKASKAPAPIAFTRFQVNNQDIVPGREDAPLSTDINSAPSVHLAADENTVSIDFAVLDYRSGQKQACAFRLVGWDKHWNPATGPHRATYSNLPPGHYVFEVKIMGDHPQGTPRSFALVIAPPWWRTTWAYLVYFALAIALLEAARRIALTLIRLRNRITVEKKLTDLKIRFFTNISHELRTPLTLILNPLEQVLDKENLSPKNREYLSVARKNTLRMVRFMNQLLDFQKMQSGKMRLRPALTEMVSFVHGITEYFSAAAREKGVTLSVSTNVRELHAWIDAEKIDIVLYNLLSNALKFAPKGTAIDLRLREEAGRRFTISVSDEGRGVPADQLAAIFELYYEVDQPQGAPVAGTGIGLALSKEIIQLHKGSIKARNNPQAGLTVTVELGQGQPPPEGQEGPLSVRGPHGAEFPASPAPSVPAPAEAPVVLLVEDNTELRLFLSDQLQPYYHVLEARNGREGWEKAKQFLPDLVISDVMMPEMDGIALLDQLKNDPATSHIPVILLTAKSSVESQVEGLGYGADYYLTKPFHVSMVVALVGNLVRQRKKRTAALLGFSETVPVAPPATVAAPGPAEPETTAEPVVITARDEEFLKEVSRIVEANLANPQFTIDMVAEALLLGRTTFYRKLKSLTNLAPVEFVKEVRLRRSRELLDEGQDDLSAIAYEVGFSSLKYFSTCFKEKYNMSPSDYLKARQEGKPPGA